jgi:hypothetical protein
MHLRLVAAIPGLTKPEDVFSAVLDPLYLYSDDNLLSCKEVGFEPGWGEWDWVQIGGRFRGAFTLTPEAVERRRNEALHVPVEGGCAEPDDLATLHRLGIAGCIPRKWWPEPLLPQQTDCARLRDIEVGSLPTPVYWIDLDKCLNEIDHSVERQLDCDNRRFRDWLHTLAVDTWLVNVDVHR